MYIIFCHSSLSIILIFPNCIFPFILSSLRLNTAEELWITLIHSLSKHTILLNKKFIQREYNQNKSNYTLIHFNLIVDYEFCWIFVFPFVYVSTSILLLYHYMYFINEINPKINLISKFKFYSLCSNWSLYFSLFNKNKTKNIADMIFFISKEAFYLKLLDYITKVNCLITCVYTWRIILLGKCFQVWKFYRWYLSRSVSFSLTKINQSWILCSMVWALAIFELNLKHASGTSLVLTLQAYPVKKDRI